MQDDLCHPAPAVPAGNKATFEESEADFCRINQGAGPGQAVSQPTLMPIRGCSRDRRAPPPCDYSVIRSRDARPSVAPSRRHDIKR